MIVEGIVADADQPSYLKLSEVLIDKALVLLGCDCRGLRTISGPHCAFFLELFVGIKHQ